MIRAGRSLPGGQQSRLARCARLLLTLVGAVSTQGALAADDSVESWETTIGSAAWVDFSAGTVPGVTDTTSSLRQYRHGEWLLFTRHESSSEIGPAAMLLCNGLLLANFDHFSTEADGAPRSMPAAQIAWSIALSLFNAQGIAGGLQLAGLSLPEPGRTHLQELVDDALWEDGPLRARVSRSLEGDITVRLDGDDARDSDGVKPYVWSETHIGGDRSRDTLPPSMSVRGWSAGGREFFTVGQARRAGKGCPDLPDSPVWPFQ